MVIPGPPPPPPEDPFPAPSRDPLPAERRREILEQAVAYYVGRTAQVETLMEYQAVLRYGRPVNHILHLLLTVFTLGLWAPIWLLIVVLGSGERRRVLSVDPFGLVQLR